MVELTAVHCRLMELSDEGEVDTSEFGRLFTLFEKRETFRGIDWDFTECS